jgi:hypothetical protein
MRINGREWPPDPAPKPPPIPEMWLVMLLAVGSPMAAWLLDWLGYNWGRAVWPGGWLIGATVMLGSAFIRQQRTPK